MSKRLTEKHPLYQKVKELENYMLENKISLEWDGYHFLVMDTVTGEEVLIKDIDTGEDCIEFPWMYEIKLVKEE